MTRPCTLDTCEAKHFGKGYCRSHYNKFARTGSPHGNKRQTPEERFWPKVDQSGDCWEWTGGRTNGGYGTFSIGHAPISAHRYAHELLIGPIPDGLHIDHICHNRVCVNPKHLRAVTVKQNHEHLSAPGSNSKSGVRGVTPTAGGKWRADVGHNHRQYYLGRFDTIDEAEAAAIAKRNELFTHNDLDRLTPQEAA